MRFFRWILSACIFFCSQYPLWSQGRYSEKVPQVEQSGYYRIALSQEMIGVAVLNNFRGMRLLTQEGKEVAYFVERGKNPISQDRFIDLKAVDIRIDSTSSFAIVENKKEIEALYVQIKSLDVDGKQIRIRGSHDAKRWYLVKSKAAVLNFRQHFKNNDEVFEVRFPKGNYRYYEVMLTNDQEQPVEIWAIKIKEKAKKLDDKWVAVPLGTVVQKDSIDKKTYLHFPESKQQYFIEKIEFYFADSRNFRRKVVFGDTSFVVSSKSKVITLNEGTILHKNSLFVIDNENNEPLTLQAVKAYAMPVYLYAYISVEQQLSVSLNPAVTEIPNYDIAYFKNDIPSEVVTLEPTGFKYIPKQILKQSTVPKAERWFESEFLMWGIIIVVGVFLFWICFRIAGDIQKKP